MELNPVYTYISQYILLSVSVGWELSKYCIGTVCAQDSMRACVCVCVCVIQPTTLKTSLLIHC